MEGPQAVEPPEGLVIHSGIDWLEGSIYGEIEDKEAFARLWDSRHKAADERTDGRLFTINDMVAEVQPISGTGIGTNRMRHVVELKGGAIRICIADVSQFDGKGKRAIARIQMKGMACIGMHERRCIEEARRIIAGLGIKNPTMEVSRVDHRADVWGVGMDYFSELFKQRAVVAQPRTRSPILNGWDVETLRFGAGGADVQLKLYDKRAELKASKTGKAEAYKEAYPEWEPGNTITRVEVQLKRDALRDMAIRTLDDLEQRLALMTFYITHKWVRFVDRESATRIERCKADPVWAQVGEAVYEKLMTGEEPSEPIVIPLKDVEAMFLSAEGCLTSAAAEKGLTYPEMLDHMYERMEERRHILEPRLMVKNEARLVRIGEIEVAGKESNLRTIVAIGETFGQAEMDMLRRQRDQTERVRRSGQWPQNLDGDGVFDYDEEPDYATSL